MSSGSLAFRAFLAVALMVGFYLFAIAIAGALFFIAIAQVVWAERIHLQLFIACIAGGGIVLWSIWPRGERFEAPGPLLTAERQPKLFSLLEETAKATGQAMPGEVYLVADMNAFVSQRGGWMGMGASRFMGLGLPLMQMLSVTELRAVLAHEFGHYHGGDTALGPFIYQTRAALGRTVQNLHEAGSLLKKPFEWYGKLFLLITQAISRRQEYAADALAARTVGGRPLGEGLKRVHGGALAFDAYWQGEYLPLLESGWRAPMAAGFSRFTAAAQLTEAMEKVIADELESGEGSLYDTHPPLRERLAALEGQPELVLEDDPRPAASILEGIADLERALLAGMGGEDTVARLKDVDWDAVGDAVYAPMWLESAREAAPVLGELRAGEVPTDREGLARLGERLIATRTLQVPPDPELRIRYAAGTLAAAVAALLVERGWEVSVAPGEPATLEKDGARAEPFGLLEAIAAGEKAATEWSALVERTGLASVTLAPPATAGDV